MPLEGADGPLDLALVPAADDLVGEVEEGAQADPLAVPHPDAAVSIPVAEALEHFGDPRRDRGIWVWYCQRIGLDTFLDLADEIISSWNQREIKWPVRAFQRHLKDTLPNEGER